MKRWPAVVVAGLVVVLVAGGVLWWRSSQQTDLQRAVALAPEGSQRLTWTDWAGVRRELGAGGLSGSSGTGELATFLDDAYDADLSPMSSLVESAETMQAEYGFSPATLEWELFTQSPDGAAVLMKLPEDADTDALADGLEELGYTPPDEEGGTWRGGADLLPAIGTLTPELQYLALDADQGVVVASDTGDYAERAMESVTGEADAVSGLDEVVEAVGTPLAAAVYDADVACSSLSMGNAGPADQDQADQLVEAAGEVNPLTGFAMGLLPDRDVRVAMSLETEDQARADADSRAALAAGPAPGQGGEFGDRFRLGRVAAEGEVVTMELDPVEGSYVLSDLTSGPVLFATC
ncbi:hypothetical protein [Nocardioides euryhalodurans]|uniref:DUF3352 domain-containing protein n=1 Tax=Nocardioides euryhalodurans TaxID=2518370 RepID=A0A4P7GN78_9ACTN|nr:hypothetical protein [Nocardioides euryhalodurans]QBR93344.1 hypothetical protein EXE57_14540 [Nocardioides euryhalodurans]